MTKSVGMAPVKDVNGAAEFPGFITRFMKIVPMIEMMGILKDHRNMFRTHFYEAFRHDPQQLKSSLAFILEMEILMGALFMSFAVALFLGVFEDKMRVAFVEGNVASIEFWLAITGSLAVLIPMLFVALAYVALMLLMPVSKENAYAFCRTPSVNRCFLMCTQLMLVMFYDMVFFTVLTLIYKLGANIIGSLLVLFSTFSIFGYGIINFCMAFNLSIAGGACIARDVTKCNQLDLTPEECEQIFYQRAVRANQEGLLDHPGEFFRREEKRYDEKEHSGDSGKGQSTSVAHGGGDELGLHQRRQQGGQHGSPATFGML